MTQLLDDKIDEWLRRDFSAVPDDGFTLHVVRALPPRQRQPRWLMPTAALVGSLAAWLTLLPSPLLQQATREWLAGDIGATSAMVCALLLGLGLLGCSWALEESQ